MLDGDEVFELFSDGNRKGLRKVNNLHQEIDKMINTSVPYLKNMITKTVSIIMVISHILIKNKFL